MYDRYAKPISHWELSVDGSQQILGGLGDEQKCLFVWKGPSDHILSSG